ncbi:MAG: phospho-N-acetylmuramoyl-pentapeptide-transferase [Candidatus Muiribacteriota bacterium]
MINFFLTSVVHIDYLNSITIRAILAFFISFVICFILMPEVKKRVIKRNLGQQIRECGPEAHMTKKGNATMGGIAIVISVVLVTLFFGKWNPKILISLYVMVSMALVGFIDDILKIKNRCSDGLSAKVKFLLIFMFASGALFLIMFYTDGFSYVLIPVLNMKVNEKILFVILGILTITASANSVNLTDGLDGLAGGVLISVVSVYTAISYIAGNKIYSQHLDVPYIHGAGELTILTGALIGALVGFLWYNSYPAQIFMGDVGSLSLGAVTGILAIWTKTELLFIVIGGIFVIEALSVIIQVLSYRYRKKKVFKMSPIHHHFELSNLHETKVVIRFWIISTFMALGGFLLYVINVLFR